MAEQTGDRDAMAALLEALEGNAALGVVFMLFLVGLYLGLVLLVVGGWRARRVTLWSTGAVVAAVVLASVPIVDGAEYVAEALVILGLGAAGVGVRADPETRWHDAPLPLLRLRRLQPLHELTSTPQGM
ncbi:MAG: hypothetical protein JWR85_3191 [Marmoricola sp.]|nr:hypothetical protein [Marmoricola sp.]